MKTSFVILGALLVVALIALKVTSRKDGTSTQPTQDAQQQKKSSPGRVKIRPSDDPAAPALAARQTSGTLKTNETNGIALATYLEQWRAHHDGGEPRFPPGADTNKLPAFLPLPHASKPEETQAARERMEAAREQWRLELKGKGEYKEMFAKEEEWK